MFIEPSILEVLDFLQFGYLPSTAVRTVSLEVSHGEPYCFMDFIDDDKLLEVMIRHHSSSTQQYFHMKELVRVLTADFESASDGSVKMSCMLLKECGSINFGFSMSVNGLYVSYDLYYDLPCTK